jgi:hypothetical protein
LAFLTVEHTRQRGIASVVEVEVDELEVIHVRDKLPVKLKCTVHRIGELQTIRRGVEQLQDLLFDQETPPPLSARVPQRYVRSRAPSYRQRVSTTASASRACS